MRPIPRSWSTVMGLLESGSGRSSVKAQVSGRKNLSPERPRRGDQYGRERTPVVVSLVMIDGSAGSRLKLGEIDGVNAQRIAVHRVCRLSIWHHPELADDALGGVVADPVNADDTVEAAVLERKLQRGMGGLGCVSLTPVL